MGREQQKIFTIGFTCQPLLFVYPVYITMRYELDTIQMLILLALNGSVLITVGNSVQVGILSGQSKW